jgi:hypothetical protein
MVIYAYVADTLEECYETPGDGLQRWQMQLGEEDEGYLRWLRVAQPGDRPHYGLTLENVTLNPERVSRSTWKFLVCKGRQMTETVWLSAALAWNMPVSRVSADAATRLGLTERPRTGAKEGRATTPDDKRTGSSPRLRAGWRLHPRDIQQQGDRGS